MVAPKSWDRALFPLRPHPLLCAGRRRRTLVATQHNLEAIWAPFLSLSQLDEASF